MHEAEVFARYRIAEVFLFDTCTHKCGYCHFAESGKVLDNSQIRPYRDPDFIDQFAGFFSKRTTTSERWLLTLTGGEPLLMPNLDRFCDKIGESGNKVALNTALLVGERHPSLRYLLEKGADVTDYVMVSFHPEAEKIEDAFFGRLEALKAAGHSVIFRFVGHPDRLHRLDQLAARCKRIDIAFYPTPMFSPTLPLGYTPQQRTALLEHATSLSQLIQMRNGIDTARSLCTAGSDMIAVDMRTGQITPCISVHEPILGNIYDDELQRVLEPTRCPVQGTACSCEIHFQQNIVLGAHDATYFNALKRGFVEPIAVDALEGQLEIIDYSSSLALIGRVDAHGQLAFDASAVKAAFDRHAAYFRGAYAESNHPAFKRGQFAPVHDE